MTAACPLPALPERQAAFTAHLRDPAANPPPPDLPAGRLAVYRELFFNNIEGFLDSGFPVLRRITPDAAWRALAEEFFARHRCQTPLFLEIGREFLHYLEHERGERPEDPPFLLELAHYEWVELALSVAEEELETIPADRDGDPFLGVPVLSPLAWPLGYRFPVHRIGPDYQPREAPERPTHLLVYRRHDDQVGFLEANAVTLRLLELLRDDPSLSGRSALERIARELGHPKPDLIFSAGRRLLAELAERDIVLGTRG